MESCSRNSRNATRKIGSRDLKACNARPHSANVTKVAIQELTLEFNLRRSYNKVGLQNWFDDFIECEPSDDKMNIML